MRNSKIYRAGLATTVMTVLLLTGCSTQTSASTESSTTPAPSVAADGTPAPVDEPTETVVPAAGTVLPAKPEAVAEGQMAFELPDQTYVIVDADEPLPEPVRAIAEAEVLSRVALPEGMNRAAVNEAAQNYAGLLSLQTGKHIVVVFPTFGGCGREEPYDGWTSTTVAAGDPRECRIRHSLEEAQQRVADVIATQPDPQTYEVFVRGQ